MRGHKLGHTAVSRDPYLRPSWRTLSYFFPKGGEGGGEEGDEGTGELSQRARKAALLAKHDGDAARALEELMEANGRLSRKVDTLTRERDAAKALIPEGGRVITKEEGEDLDAYRKIGVKPSDVVAATALQEAQGRLAVLDAQQVHEAAAKALGWKGTVLHDLAKDKGLHVEVKNEKVDGKDVPRPYVRPKADEKAALVLLQDYVKSNLPDYLPALATTERILPDQHSAGSGGGSGSGSTVFDQWQKEQAEVAKGVTNPLQPAAAAAT